MVERTDKQRLQNIERQKRYAQRHPEKIQARNARAHARRSLDPEFREKKRLNTARWREAQEQRNATRPMPDACEVCNQPSKVKLGALHYDHDHSTGRFRGWLCHHCNTALGLLADDVARLRRLISYLEASRRHDEQAEVAA